jgi:hypothetical protein
VLNFGPSVPSLINHEGCLSHLHSAKRDPSIARAFLVLVFVQAAHSLEEYYFRLWEVFWPPRMLSSLVSSNLPLGFAVLNIAIVVFGSWCYLFRVAPRKPGARALAWGWAVVELLNGIVHPAIGLLRGNYFPGTITAPALFAVSLWLIRDLIRPSTRP